MPTRTYSSPWKGIYGQDRRYTARVDRARERGQYTEPGTPSNGPKQKPTRTPKDRKRRHDPAE